MSRSALPQLHGQGWRVFRDPHGVPHVQAESLNAVAQGHGAVTAHDRVWHLEVLRCRAEARSAQLLMSPDKQSQEFLDAVDADHLSAAFDIQATARRWWEAASAKDRDFFAAYAQGVNAQLAAAWAKDPDVRSLGRNQCSPRPWEPWTPIAVHLDAHLLTGSLPEQLWRRRVSNLLGDTWLSVLDAEAPRTAGSNAWLVPGHLSVSGAPLIAADPHRVVEESGPYQPVCFSAPGLRVRGLALVGLPGVPHFGRTESAAWAITASMTRTEVLEEITVTRRAGALVEAVSGLGVSERQVHLAGGHVRSVRQFKGHPVLPGDAIAENRVAELDDGDRAVVTVVRQAAPLHPTGALAACRQLLTATTTTEVLAAWDGWVTPVNDLVCADTTGHCVNTVVGSFLGNDGGLVCEPLREISDLTIRANQLPADEVQSSHRVVCAPPHRAQRAQAVLQAAVDRDGHVQHEDLMAAQMDTVHAIWPDLLSHLLTPLGDTEKAGHPGLDTIESRPTQAIGLSEAGADLRRCLLTWDARMHADSRAAADFALWREAFAQRLADLPVFQHLQEATGLPGIWAPFLGYRVRIGLALESLIQHGPALGVDVTAAAHQALEDAARMRVRAGQTPESTRQPWHNGASQDVAAEPKPDARTWGQLHAFRPWRAHPQLPPHPAVAIGGDTDCLLAAGTLPGCGTACMRVPAARVVWDLADPAASLWITPDPVNRGETSQAPLHRWAAGELDQALAWVAPGGLGMAASSSVNYPAVKRVDLGKLDALVRDAGGRPLITGLRAVTAADAELVHSWVSARRAKFWGMNGLSVDQVQAIYNHLADSPTHEAWIVEVDGEPVGLFQTYQPHADPTGVTYRIEPGDLGVHVLLGPSSNRIRGFTAALGAALLRRASSNGTRRVVVEPDVANGLALSRMQAMGFQLGPKIQLPGKTGQLAFLPCAEPSPPRSNSH